MMEYESCAPFGILIFGWVVHIGVVSSSKIPFVVKAVAFNANSGMNAFPFTETVGSDQSTT